MMSFWELCVQVQDAAKIGGDYELYEFSSFYVDFVFVLENSLNIY